MILSSITRLVLIDLHVDRLPEEAVTVGVSWETCGLHQTEARLGFKFATRRNGKVRTHFEFNLDYISLVKSFTIPC